jgi:hypothetical protein
MDSNTLTTAGLATTFTVAAVILYKVYLVVNHKRCKSNCCGRFFEASLDIENTTPPHGGFNTYSEQEYNKAPRLEAQGSKLYVQTAQLNTVVPPLNLQRRQPNVIDNPMRPKLVTP